MSLEDFSIKKKYVGIAIALGIVSGIIQFQCNEQNARKIDAAAQQQNSRKVKDAVPAAETADANTPATDKSSE